MVEKTALLPVHNLGERGPRLKHLGKRPRGVSQCPQRQAGPSAARRQHDLQIRLLARSHGRDDRGMLEPGVGLPGGIGAASHHNPRSRRPNVGQRVGLIVLLDYNHLATILPQRDGELPSPLPGSADNGVALPARETPEIELVGCRQHEPFDDGICQRGRRKEPGHI